MENGACTVNHDHIFCALSANSVRHARRNDDSDVIVAPMVIAIDKETHHPLGKARADVAQNYLNATLQEKHYVPLLISVTAQRIILRFVDEQAAQPLCRELVFWNAGRMHVETFCRVCEHPRSRPLLRPEANLRENPFVAPHKFREAPTMPLRINFARENFHARYPDFFDLALVPVGSHKFARVHASLRAAKDSRPR